MIEIVFAACLLAKPDVCADYQLRFEAERSLTPQQCMHMAMPELAKWQEGHPNHVIRRWKCGKPSKEA